MYFQDLHTPVQATHLEVKPRPGETLDRMIKRFLKKIRNDGILQLFVERSRFDKPSVQKKKKSAKARFLAKKLAEKLKK